MRTSPHELLTQIAAGEDSFLEFKELVFAGRQVKGPKRKALARFPTETCRVTNRPVGLGDGSEKTVLVGALPLGQHLSKAPE